MVYKGKLIHYADNGKITTQVERPYLQKEEIDSISAMVNDAFNQQEFLPLPPLNYQMTGNSIKELNLQGDNNQLLDAGNNYSYTMIYKSENYNTVNMNAYSSKIQQQNERITKLQKQLIEAQRSRRNTKWVGILSVIILILGFFVWTKVLFPNEVTKYNTGEYLYYGPMSNGKPNGVGVAIYRKDDKDKRLYYYGNFVNGERMDKNAIMFYRDGSYFKGAMQNDKWQKGIFTDVDGATYIGSFSNNLPQNGTWYKLVKVQNIIQKTK